MKAYRGPSTDMLILMTVAEAQHKQGNRHNFSSEPPTECSACQPDCSQGYQATVLLEMLL